MPFFIYYVSLRTSYDTRYLEVSVVGTISLRFGYLSIPIRVPKTCFTLFY